MNEQEIERLLYSSESDELDFKRDQYPLTNNDEKGELIKDILAFANSWRKTTAYILIGVDEAKVAGRSTPVGVTTHLKDSDLQQLVNSKTNRKVAFSYQPISFKGFDLGVISVPEQQRPIVLTGNFGKLSKDTVYVRRGSSTDIAGATEVINMANDLSTPSLELQFADLETHQLLGRDLSITSTVVRYNPQSIPLITFPSFSVEALLGRGQSDYYRHKARYIAETSLLGDPIGLYLRNGGTVLAVKPKVVIQGKVTPHTVICDSRHYPEYPQQDGFSVPSISLYTFDKIDYEVYGNDWTISVPFADIQPKNHDCSDGSFYIGATQDMKLDLSASIYANNLSDPITMSLSVTITVKERDLKLDELDIED